MLNFGQIYRVGFGASVPVASTRMIVDAPAKVSIRTAVQLLPALLQDRREENGRIIWTYTHGRMEPLEDSEPHAPGSVPSYPRIAISTGTSWQALAREYGRVLDEKIKDADVRTFVEKAKVGSDRNAIIASLVRQLHDQVRYTGVEFAEASIIPQAPSETLKRKYGDCKDKSALLVAMLRAAGIPATLALLSTGPGEDSPKDLPGLGIFDHAIVYVPGPPALWIDATADYSRIEQFPPADQGRLALIISPEVQELSLTPELGAADNRVVESRDVYLAEKGPARFQETTQVQGFSEGDYRAYYQSKDQKERRKEFEEYVKDEYVSDRLLRFETSDIKDFSAPFKLTLEAAEARRGYTTLTDADVYISTYRIMNRLPDALTSDPEEEKGQEEKAISERDKRKRRNDFLFTAPFITEWQYRIHPPLGFVVRAAPDEEVYHLGPATLTTRFSREVKDGVLLGSVTMDSGKRRWTAADVEEFRAAYKKWKQTDIPHIAFSLKGKMLLNNGSVKDGVSEYKALIAQHPKEAIHHIQLAYALLGAGLGEGARAEARLATQLEPTSAEAFKALGWVLQHDLVGRRFRKGFQLTAAQAAYKKSLELDAKAKDTQIDYAILLEYNVNGVRYGQGAQLEEALKQYVAVSDKLKDYSAEDNPLYLRLFMGRYPELIAELNKLPRTDARLALLLSAMAASQGVPAAIAEGSKLQVQGGARMRVMSASSQQLVSLRLYKEASDLLAAAVEGTDKAATESGRARLLASVNRFDQQKVDRNDPAGLVRLMFSLFVQDDELTDDVLGAFSLPATISSDPRVREADFKRSRRELTTTRSSFRRNSMELPVLRDVMLTLAQTSADYDGLNTYRIRLTMPGSPPAIFYATRFENKLYGSGGSRQFEGLGHEFLRRAIAGEVEPSKKVLDWLRDEVKITGGEDPLSGPIFPHLYTRGQELTANDLSLLGAVLITTADRNTRPAIAVLEQALAQGVPAASKPYVQLALAQAYLKDEHFKEVLPLAAELRQAYPDSITAFSLSCGAFHANNDFASWEALAKDRLTRLPDDVDAIRSLAQLESARGDSRRSISQRARLVDIGKAEVGDFNNLAWQELFDGNVTSKGLEYGQQGSMLAKQQNAPLLHTMAAVYAETGKTTEAREMILKAMDQWGLEEPDSSSWYVFGRIAEQYGMLDDAVTAYKKVEKPDFDWEVPGSTYQLATRRLAVIASSVPAVNTKAAK